MNNDSRIAVPAEVGTILGYLASACGTELDGALNSKLFPLLSHRDVYHEFLDAHEGFMEKIDGDTLREKMGKPAEFAKSRFGGLSRLALFLAQHSTTNPFNILSFWQKASTGLDARARFATPKIFISHKANEEKRARFFRDILLKLLPANMQDKITIAEDFPKGEDWRERITQEIVSSHWFFLLMPNEQTDLGWLTSEFGVFEGSRTPVDRFIWISSSGAEELPQYSHLMSCRYEIDDLKKLFDDLLLKAPIEGIDMKPIRENIDVDDLEMKITEWLRDFPPVTITEWRQVSTFDVIIKKDEPKCTVDDLKEMPVSSVSTSALNNIFKIQADYGTFGRLVRNIDAATSGNYWMTELASAIQEALRGGIVSNIEGTFADHEQQRIYHPFVYAVFRDQHEMVRRVRVVISPGMPFIWIGRGKIGALMAALRYSYRFRAQIIEHFKDGIRGEDDIGTIARLLNQMEGESLFERGIQGSELETCFETEDDKTIMRRLVADWKEFRNPIDQENLGLLDKAIKNDVAAEVELILQKMEETNKKFVEMGTKRLLEFIQKSW